MRWHTACNLQQQEQWLSANYPDTTVGQIHIPGLLLSSLYWACKMAAETDKITYGADESATSLLSARALVKQSHQSWMARFRPSLWVSAPTNEEPSKNLLHLVTDDKNTAISSRKPADGQCGNNPAGLHDVCKRIERLPPQCRQVFLLSRIHGMNYSEIAKHCNISTKLVEKYVGQALLALLKS